MEQVEMRMNPKVLDQRWRYGHGYFLSFALANTVVISNFVYRQLSQGLCKWWVLEASSSITSDLEKLI